MNRVLTRAPPQKYCPVLVWVWIAAAKGNSPAFASPPPIMRPPEKYHLHILISWIWAQPGAALSLPKW
jgi:hypothetical protein